MPETPDKPGTASNFRAPKVKISKESVRGAMFLFSYLRPYRAYFLIAVIALVCSTLAGLMFPGLMGSLVDAVTGSPAGGNNPLNTLGGTFSDSKPLDLGVIVVVLFATMLVQGVFGFIRSYFLSVVAESALSDLRHDLYAKIVRLPMNYFHQHRVGELSSRINSDVTIIQTTITFTASELIRQSLTLVGGVTLVAITSTRLTVIILTAVPLIVVIAVIFGRAIRTASKTVQDLYAQLNTIVEETFQAISIVKSFTAEERETTRYRDKLRHLVGVSLKVARTRALFTAFIMLVLFGGTVGVIWYGGTLVQQKELSFGTLTSFVLYATFVGGALGSFADLYGMLQRALGASERVRDIMINTEAEDVDAGSPVTGRRYGEVELRNLSFVYPTRPDIQVLKNISIEVAAGSSLALVGPSGAGKTTIAGILMRFFEPSEGMLLIDGTDARGVSLTDHRSAISIVPQDVTLFGGTIAENIAYGRPEATEAEIVTAARLANAMEFIQGFPEGFQTVVGERGIQLSGGQRQRVAIARGILKDPSILILDEATSFLDSESERLVQEALERVMRGRTTIIIAHRLSTVRTADKIAVMRNGQIMESGSYDQLLQLDGLFARLVAVQNRTGEDIIEMR